MEELILNSEISEAEAKEQFEKLRKSFPRSEAPARKPRDDPAMKKIKKTMAKAVKNGYLKYEIVLLYFYIIIPLRKPVISVRK